MAGSVVKTAVAEEEPLTTTTRPFGLSSLFTRHAQMGVGKGGGRRACHKPMSPSLSLPVCLSPCLSIPMHNNGTTGKKRVQKEQTSERDGEEGE